MAIHSDTSGRLRQCRACVRPSGEDRAGGLRHPLMEARLKQEFQAKLDLARRSGPRDLSKGWIARVRVRTRQIDVVEGVEHFTAELERLVLADLCIFEDGKVPVLAPRPPYCSGSRVA